MRLIDADPFEKMIIHVPEEVYDPLSFCQGAETVLRMIREAETESSLLMAAETPDPRFDPLKVN